MLRIGIVDDHKLFRKSLALLITTFDGVSVVIEAKNGKEFIDTLEETPIDLVLLDIQMPEMDGYETCKVLHELYPNIKILIVSQLTTRESIHKIMDLGAHGYFTKNSDPDQLEFAIKSLNDKGFYFGMELGEVLREAILWEKKTTKKPLDSSVSLSKRELEIIVMASKELSSAEIADKLCINIRTVETHRKRIMEKTKAKNFIGVVLFALKHQYIALDDL
ncbi:response regulator transcription factor [Flavobacterium sp.]|uniref:response regulator transcription factor n=1 Tax=Flavobacterium sp. TaxID=239 RepID=UPI002614752E|nr:response regulator transcription factor [Flavobacterium sp.]